MDWKILLPLSNPLLAALCVLTAVGGWSICCTQSPDLHPLPYCIRKPARAHSATGQPAGSAMASASLPMVIACPFAQQYFVQGVLLGSVKG